MLFNSLEFAVFFPVVVAAFFMIPRSMKVPWLLLASCIFYMAFIPSYIFILFITIMIDYLAGMGIEKVDAKHRKPLLLVSILSTCFVLLIFKYLYFAINSVVSVSSLFGAHLSPPTWNIILPIGLSFHTFQSLSYVIEVYRGNQRAEKNLIIYATYVMFFPQLVAGPIERPQNLLHQFREHHAFSYDNVTQGLKRMAYGFFKKVVIADRLALYVNDVYKSPKSANGAQLTIATVFFAYQIYCDFSGYSDIAIGAARVMGFHLMENFDSPYHSLSIGEFWHRWHISLSTWFKDYLYIPMGGNRVGRQRHILNLMITFAVSGLWHGANWTYVIWGTLNGAYLVFGQLSKPYRDRIMAACGLVHGTIVRRSIQLGTTFALTCFAWIFFRAKSFTDAIYILSHMAVHWDLHHIATEQFYMRQFPVAVGSILLLELASILKGRQLNLAEVIQRSMPLRWAVYASLIVVIILFGVYRSTQFIYFQF
jgi:alginate O-acetyltransferase complex protein AlgI